MPRIAIIIGNKATFYLLLPYNAELFWKEGREREPEGSHKNEIWPAHVPLNQPPTCPLHGKLTCFGPQAS